MKKKDVCWLVIAFILAFIFVPFISGLSEALFVEKLYQLIATFVISVVAAFVIDTVSDTACGYLCQGNIKNLLKNTFNKSFIFGYFLGLIFGLITIYSGIVVIKVVFG